MNNFRMYILALTTVIITMIASASASAANLKLKITGIRSKEGNIMIAIYNGEKHFLDDDRYVYGATKKAKDANDGTLYVNFKGIKSGRYAVAIYHDENNNDKLDKNFFGIPKEGYGFSNNARGRFTAPKFKKAAFNMSDKSKAMTLYLSY